MAGHSTATLTLDRYTHVGLHDLDAAVDGLPALPIGNNNEAPKLRATVS